MSNLDNEQNVQRLYEFGGFLLDPNASTSDSTKDRLVLNGDPYEISDRAFTLLRIFVQEPGREFEREGLVNALWPEHNLKPGELSPMRPRKPQTDEEKNEEGRKRSIRNKLQQLVGDLRGSVRDNIGWESIETTKAGYRFVFPVEIREIGPKSDRSFEQWISQDVKGRRLSLAVVGGVLLSVAYLFAYLILADDSWHKPIVVFSLIQAVMIVAALFIRRRVFAPDVKAFFDYDPPWVRKKFGYDRLDEWKDAKAGAKTALEHYAVYWKRLLVSWLFIYSLLFVTLYLESGNGGRTALLYALNIALTTFNNCNSLMISLCFIILNNPNAYRSEEEQSKLMARLRKVTSWGAAAIVLFTLVESILLFVIQTGWPASIHDNRIVKGADMASGIVGGVTLALYVGRVQTRFLGPSPWIPLAFYLYAVIQPLFVFIKDFVRGELIIETALILKALLYLYVAWLFQSGRLLFYFVRMRAIFERVDLDWRTFLSILR